MAYNRINWEDAPSTETPLNADNLNAMDAGIAAVDALLSEVQDGITGAKEDLSLLEARVDTIVALPEGTTALDAEIIDARIDGAGHTWPSLGAAIRSGASLPAIPSTIGRYFLDLNVASIDGVMTPSYSWNRNRLTLDIPDVPDTDGSYRLRVDVSNGGHSKTIYWEKIT